MRRAGEPRNASESVSANYSVWMCWTQHEADHAVPALSAGASGLNLARSPYPVRRISEDLP